MAMAARTTAVVSFTICFIFGVGCSWRGAVANGGGSLGGCVANRCSCGVAVKLSNRFFGALGGARFFFGFRPRLLGIGKLVGWHGFSCADLERICSQRWDCLAEVPVLCERVSVLACLFLGTGIFC